MQGLLKCLKNLYAQIVLGRTLAIAFKYFIYRYIEIVMIVGHKMSCKNARISATILSYEMVIFILFFSNSTCVGNFSTEVEKHTKVSK